MRFENLPNWNITSEQPGFYDVESGTTLQQTARLYKKIYDLIDDYNSFSSEMESLITNAKNYMQDNLIQTEKDILNEAIENDEINVRFAYNTETQELFLKCGGEIV